MHIISMASWLDNLQQIRGRPKWTIYCVCTDMNNCDTYAYYFNGFMVRQFMAN